MEESERRALYEETGLGGDIGENVVAAEQEVGEAEQAAERRQAPLTVTGTAEGGEVEVKGAVGVARGQSTKIQGIAGVVTGTNTKLTGYAEVAAARDEVEIEKGAAALVLAGRKVELQDHGYAAIAIAPKVEVQDGGRVFITALAAVLGGLALGTGFGLILVGAAWLLVRSGYLEQFRAGRIIRTVAGSSGRRLRGAIRGAIQA